MNIQGLIRNLMGDLTAADSKVLELKVGQVVKGVVLQLLGDQEAMLNIGGVQVRAKLETPLKQGDVTMLQVQPESGSGQIVLKPLSSSDVQIADESLGELLKSFALKDNAVNRQVVQHLQQEGVPLSKETAQAFAGLANQTPEGVSKAEWMQAAVLAFKRALPLTQETVASIRQATAGPPMGDVLETLEQQVTALLKEQPAHKAADALAQVASLLKELRAASAAAWTARPPAQQAAASPPPPAAQEGEPPAPAPSGQAQPASAPSAGAGARTAAPQAAAAAAPAAGQAQPPAHQAARAAAAPAAQPRSAEPAAAGEPPRAGSPAQAAPAAPDSAPAPAASSSAPPERAAASRAAAEPAPAAAQKPAPAAGTQDGQEAQEAPKGDWISRLLKAVGVEHEHRVAKLADQPELSAQRLSREAADLTGLLAPAEAASDSAAAKPAAADTLKSLLLQLSAADSLPAPLKDAAQQALQQITGQQLLLSSDKSSMFSHVTLFIPFMDGSGQQSAAVHIQSRKGKRGEVDASNCRLLFDLQMKALGSTLVDVQVVNRIVSLHVHNDEPAVAALLEGSRQDIAASLQQAGFQFLSLKCSPFPQPIAAKEGEQSEEGAKRDHQSLYRPKQYKGVDFRV